MTNEKLAKQAGDRVSGMGIRPMSAFDVQRFISSTYAPVFKTVREMRDALKRYALARWIIVILAKPSPSPTPTWRSKMMYEIIECKNHAGEWLVEKVCEEGEVFMARFSGPDAFLRASAYKRAMNTPPPTETSVSQMFWVFLKSLFSPTGTSK